MDLLPDLTKANGNNAVELPSNASPLDFLCAIYRDPGQPMQRRLSAAIAAAPYVHPKLAVTANVQDQGIAALLEARLRRIAEAKNAEINSKMIENQPAQIVRMVPDQRLRRV
jgi:hypothetical protein